MCYYYRSLEWYSNTRRKLCVYLVYVGDALLYVSIDNGVEKHGHKLVYDAPDNQFCVICGYSWQICSR